MSELRLGRHHVSAIVVILTMYALLAFIYSLIVPLGEGPDEAPHFTVVRYIVQYGRLPSTEEEHEAFQPPLYYLLGAGLTFWADYEGYVIKANADYSLEPGAPKNLLLHDQTEAFPYRGPALAWHVLRLFSILCGGVTIWATYRLGLAVFPERPALAVAMAALNAFIPEFLFMSSLVNNDNLAAALAALLLWQIARLVRGREDGVTLASLGVLLGLGILAKVSVAIAALPAGLALVYAAWRREKRAGPAIRRAVLWGLLVVGLALAISGWWFVRNQLLFGDATGWAFVLKTNALREGPLTPAVIGWLVKGLFKSFWLAWIGIALDAWIYGVLLALCLAALAGLIRLLVRRRQWVCRDTWVILGLLGLHLALVFGSLLKWTATVLGTDQARLLYPALPALLLFLTLGLAQWLPARRDHWLAGGLAVSFLALAIAAPWVYIAPVHAPPAPIPPEELARVATSADVRFGEAIRLVGYRVASDSVPAGGWLVVDLYWETSRPIEEDIWLTLSLAGDPAQPLVTKDGSPSAGRDTTDRWKLGVIIPSRHRLPVPDWAPAGRYGLWAGLHPFGRWEWLPAGPEGQPRVKLVDVEVKSFP